jgi:hypothetical protein
MLLQINGLCISNLQKASSDKVIRVDITANHLTEDTEKETVLKEAFNDEAVKEFLSIGVIDFWHDSRNPALTKEEKNAAIVGKPVAFRWDNGLPVVTAELTKGHPRVAEMLPHLEAEQPVYAASIGGAKMVLEVRDDTGDVHRVIPKIKWDHLAIAPANQVINRAPGVNVKLLRKANSENELMCEFSDYGLFSSNHGVIEQEATLMKALAAPSSVSDMYTTSGGAITRQSLEGKITPLTFDEDESMMLLDTIMGIKKHVIPLEKADYIKHFESQNKKDFGKKSFRLFDKYFKSRKER